MSRLPDLHTVVRGAGGWECQSGMAKKDCPLCGEMMEIKDTQSSTQIPGNPKPTILIVHEWVCADCEYFEEAGIGDED